MIIKTKQLSDQVEELIKETRKNGLVWKMQIETTDDLEADIKEKLETEEGEFVVDECFVSYECVYRKKEFRMISYERILTRGDAVRSNALIFMPPEGLRYFDVAVLAPYAVDNDAILSDRVHNLFKTLMELHNEGSDQVKVQYIDPLTQNVL